jgi:hypothetical protein
MLKVALLGESISVCVTRSGGEAEALAVLERRHSTDVHHPDPVLIPCCYMLILPGGVRMRFKEQKSCCIPFLLPFMVGVRRDASDLLPPQLICARQAIAPDRCHVYRTMNEC